MHHKHSTERSRARYALASVLGIGLLALPALAQQRARAGADSAVRLSQISGFKTPVSVRHDPAQDVYFVSSVNGGGADRDNNGFISRLEPDGGVTSLLWVSGGRNGVTLNAPKGMAIQGDTLWVTDIDEVRGFDRRTGRALASVSLATLGAVFLNDIAVGPRGDLYITDSGLRFGSGGGAPQHVGPDRIFRIGRGHVASVVLADSRLATPTGIAWDSSSNVFVVVPLNGSTILAWTLGDSAAHEITRGPGDFDGVQVISAGQYLVSSQQGTLLLANRNGVRPVVRGVPTPADIGLDRRRARVLVPLLEDDRVEVWQLPAGVMRPVRP